MTFPAPDMTAPIVVALFDEAPTLITSGFAIEIAPFTETGPAPVLLIAELAAPARRLESDPPETFTLPVDVPLNVIVENENCPGKSFVAVYVWTPLDGKNSDADAPEAGRLVQFAGLLHVLLLADSHVCDRATDGTAAIAAARIVERLKALPKGTMSFFTARMLVRFRKIWKDFRAGHHSRPCRAN